MLLRNLSNFRGKNRLVKSIYKRKIQEAKDIIVKGKYNCQYFVPNLKETIGFSLFADGVYEEETIKFINKLLPKNGTFLDLGANIGAISVPISVIRPDVKIIAVEAAPWIFSYLKTNIENNKSKNVSLINNALFNEDNIEMNFFAPDEKFGKGSLAPVFTQHGVKVRTITVDSLVKQLNIDKVDVIKIDVEGFEYFAFKGAATLLNRQAAPDIIFEFVDWAEDNAQDIKVGSAQELLFNAGYKLYKIEDHGMSELNEVQTKGSYNIFASKK